MNKITLLVAGIFFVASCASATTETMITELVHTAGNDGACSMYSSQPKISGWYSLVFSGPSGVIQSEYFGRDHYSGQDCTEAISMIYSDGNQDEGFLVLTGVTITPRYSTKQRNWFMVRYSKNGITSNDLGVYPHSYWWNTCDDESVNILHLKHYRGSDGDYLLMVEDGRRVNACGEEYKEDIKSIRITLYKYRDVSDFLWKKGELTAPKISTELYDKALEKFFIYRESFGNRVPKHEYEILSAPEYDLLAKAAVDSGLKNGKLVVRLTNNSKTMAYALGTMINEQKVRPKLLIAETKPAKTGKKTVLKVKKSFQEGKKFINITRSSQIISHRP